MATLYESTEIVEVIEQTGELLHALVMASITLAGVLVVAYSIFRHVYPRLLKRCADANTVPAILLRGFKRPLSFYFKVAGFLLVLTVFLRFVPTDLFPAGFIGMLAWLPGTLMLLVRIVTVVTVTWGLVASSDITGLVLRGARSKLDLHMSKSVTQFLSAIFKVVVIAIASVIILSELNYDINGLIAGLGLGGLTIALAAQDSASNFFGGLIIVIERPFEIGDWVTSNEVEGTIEEINLRSTKVRLSSGALTVVPNSKLSGSSLTNWTATMKRRRANFNLKLQYNTPPEKIKAFADAVQAMLEADEEILPDGLLVRFSDFSTSSLDVTVIFNTAKPGYNDFMLIKERINYKILQLAAQHGVEFAYPTRTVHIEQERPMGD